MWSTDFGTEKKKKSYVPPCSREGDLSALVTGVIFGSNDWTFRSPLRTLLTAGPQELSWFYSLNGRGGEEQSRNTWFFWYPYLHIFSFSASFLSYKKHWLRSILFIVTHLLEYSFLLLLLEVELFEHFCCVQYWSGRCFPVTLFQEKLSSGSLFSTLNYTERKSLLVRKKFNKEKYLNMIKH